MPITINNQEDIKKMRIAGKLASEVLDFITPLIEPNITTEKIDSLCHEFMTKEQGTIPAPSKLCAAWTFTLSKIYLYICKQSNMPWNSW